MSPDLSPFVYATSFLAVSCNLHPHQQPADYKFFNRTCFSPSPSTVAITASSHSHILSAYLEALSPPGVWASKRFSHFQPILKRTNQHQILCDALSRLFRNSILTYISPTLNFLYCNLLEVKFSLETSTWGFLAMKMRYLQIWLYVWVYKSTGTQKRKVAATF